MIFFSCSDLVLSYNYKAMYLNIDQLFICIYFNSMCKSSQNIRLFLFGITIKNLK